MESSNIVSGRTWQSLKERYLKIIRKKLLENPSMYELDAKIAVTRMSWRMCTSSTLENSMLVFWGSLVKELSSIITISSLRRGSQHNTSLENLTLCDNLYPVSPEHIKSLVSIVTGKKERRSPEWSSDLNTGP